MRKSWTYLVGFRQYSLAADPIIDVCRVDCDRYQVAVRSNHELSLSPLDLFATIKPTLATRLRSLD